MIFADPYIIFRRSVMNSIRRLLVLASILMFPFVVFAQGLDTTKIDQALGRPGQKIGDVYRVGFPRTDLHISVHGLAIKPALALGSWAAFLGTEDHAMVMGDLVLLESELNPVMERLRSAGFEISAVHNHLIEETPHVMYMHYMGHGRASELAASLHRGLAVSKTPLEKPAAGIREAVPPAWVKEVEESVRRKGTWKAEVLSFGVPRADTITIAGIAIAPAAGVAESLNFQDAESGNVATTGDFVLTAEEVNPVISELEAQHILVTALHSHMVTEQPRLFFLHFWGLGSPASVGAGIRAALKHVSVE
jgi:Domain of Unknown Function (DUF1259)